MNRHGLRDDRFGRIELAVVEGNCHVAEGPRPDCQIETTTKMTM
jgi:hypothetical protein